MSGKQAVILVHGMGQQIPMETLRGFVETVWVTDPQIDARWSSDPPGGNPVWWKPDGRTGSLELSRITTRESIGSTGAKGPRTDFYEIYWADVTEGNTLAQLKDWFLKTMWRWPREVPPHVRSLWLLLWVATGLAVALAAWQALGRPGVPADSLLVKGAVAFGGVLYAGLLVFLVNYFGDVARYTRAAPANIAARKAARERGLVLLRRLMDDQEGGTYDRIVLVAHSLGSILAYDLIKFLWSERIEGRTMAFGSPLHLAWEAMEEVAKSVEAARLAAARFDAAEMSPAAEAARRRLSDAANRYRAEQAKLFAAASDPALPQRWTISDFVTLGSPLAHSEFLLERTPPLFQRGVEERRFPTSPPAFDLPEIYLYSTQKTAIPAAASPGQTRIDERSVHHATPFALTRWTNIYDPPNGIVCGDFVSGPLARLFGPGIVDVEVRMRGWVGRIFTHTRYWERTRPEGPQVRELRKALRLAR